MTTPDQIQRNPFDVSWVRTGCPVNAQRQKGTPHWCHDRPQPGAWQPPVWSDLLKKRDRSNIFKNWISMDPKTYQNMMVLNSISNDPILGLYNLSIEVEDESYPTPRCSCCFILPAAGLPTVPFFVQRQFYSLQPTGAAGPAGKKGTCRDAHMVWCHCRTLTLRCTW